MKKFLVAGALVALLASSAFAEFLLDVMPLGYTNVYTKLDDYGTKLSINNYTLGVNLGYMKDGGGFYFLWQPQIGLGAGKVKYEGISVEGKSFEFKSDLLFGRGWQVISNLYITAAGGLALAMDSVAFADDAHAMLISFGIPVQVGVRYYFTDKIGITGNINETLAFGIKQLDAGEAGERTMGFINNFNMNFGVAFKF